MSSSQKGQKSLCWTNILFFSLSPLVGLAGTWWSITSYGLHWQTLVLFSVFFCGAGFGITAGYHRLFSHRAYQASWIVRLLYLFWGSASLEGSARWWAWEHRRHHRYEDQNLDPYGIQKGFWYAHIGWLLEKTGDPEVNDPSIRDLDRDPLVRFQDRYFMPLALFISFALPTLIAWTWGDPWGGFFLAGVGRLVLNQHVTFCINSFCHFIGKQTYSDKNSARDSWITALVTFGEGYHNFHHSFQGDYRNAIRAWQWDPTKWLIHSLSWAGLVRNLHRVSRERILQARILMDEKRFALNYHGHSEAVRQKAHELLEGTKARLHTAQTRLTLLNAEYRRIRAEKWHQMGDHVQHLRMEMQAAKRDFRAAWNAWRALTRGEIAI